MKQVKKYIFLLLFIFSFNSCVMELIINQLYQIQEFTPEELNLFKSAKSAKIIVNKEYRWCPDCEKVVGMLPIKEVLLEMLNFAGITLIDSNSTNYDILIEVNTTAFYIGKQYSANLRSREGTYYYTGANLEGVITLTSIKDDISHSQHFRGEIKPPKVIELGEIFSFEGNRYRMADPTSPIFAPFSRALFIENSFATRLLEMFYIIKGQRVYFNAIRFSTYPEIRKEAVRLRPVKTDNHGNPIKDFLFALKDKNVNIRIIAANRLGETNRYAILPLIETMLSDNSEEVRYSSAEALRKFSDARSIEAFIKAINDESYKVRLSSVIALSELSDTSIFHHTIGYEKEYATDCLKAVDPLIDILNNKNEGNKFQYYAAKALGNIEDPRSIEPLILLLDDENDDVVEIAKESLIKITKIKIENWKEWYYQNKSSQNN